MTQDAPAGCCTSSNIAPEYDQHPAIREVGVLQVDDQLVGLKATAFAAPLMVLAVTDFTASQRWGMVPIFALMFLGLLIMLTVPRAEDVEQT